MELGWSGIVAADPGSGEADTDLNHGSTDCRGPSYSPVSGERRASEAHSDGSVLLLGHRTPYLEIPLRPAIA